MSNKFINKEDLYMETILKTIATLLKDVVENMKETNEIRKKEQTEIWKEVKELKSTSDKMHDDIYRESESRAGIIQTQNNLYKSVCKMQNIIYGVIGVIIFINALPQLKGFIELLNK